MVITSNPKLKTTEERVTNKIKKISEIIFTQERNRTYQYWFLSYQHRKFRKQTTENIKTIVNINKQL